MPRPMRRSVTAASLHREISHRSMVTDNEVAVIPFDVAYAIKITLPRKIPSGSPGDTDIYGAQQHAPLLDLEVAD